MMRSLTVMSVLAMIMLETVSRNAACATFGHDVAFLRKHTGVVVLSDTQSGARIALAPAWQGRVMTSTAEQDAGRSFGWINRELIASRKVARHINAFGGEDRFWLGPEGGQFSIFFAQGAPFDLEHWFVPKSLDTLPFRTINRSRNSASFQAEFSVTNYSGTPFRVRVHRDVRLLDTHSAWGTLGLPPSHRVSLVAYESKNILTNVGKEPWKRETGLLSVWILGMFNSSPGASVVVPIKKGPDVELGVKVTSNYFGTIPPERMKVTDGAIFLRGDAKFRSKIGINPRRSLGRLGSYDADHQVLTIVQFNQPEGVSDYVNAQWKLQEDPFCGDVANSYNDGPPAPGAKPLGSFFEMESSSPAAALLPGASLEHTHRTLHLKGPESELDVVARAVLGVSLADIKSALPQD
jgi:hypothetical protein